MISIKDITDVLYCFPKSYLNYLGEVILCEKGNVYFTMSDCENTLDIKCKLLEWCSRAASKGEPYKAEKKNVEFRQFLINGINEYLGTKFTADDMYLIYDRIGNAVNHQLTLNFISNNYDLSILRP